MTPDRPDTSSDVHTAQWNPLARRFARSPQMMVLRLARYALLGWVLFFIVLITFVLHAMIATLRPVPVIAVNERGEVIGEFEYLNNAMRTDEEVIAASMYFVERYLSLNSASIYDDYAIALSMMSPAMQEKTLDEIKATGYLKRIANSAIHSHIEYHAPPTLLQRKGAEVMVHLIGNMVVIGTTQQDGEQTKKAFDMTLLAEMVPRTIRQTQGIHILDIRQTQGNTE